MSQFIAKLDLELHAKNSTSRISGKKAIDYGEKSACTDASGFQVSGTFDRTITLPREHTQFGRLVVVSSRKSAA